jgi:hypothetical protein
LSGERDTELIGGSRSREGMSFAVARVSERGCMAAAAAWLKEAWLLEI